MPNPNSSKPMNDTRLCRAIRPGASQPYPGQSRRQFRRAGALAPVFALLCLAFFARLAGAENEEKAEIKLLVQGDKIAEARAALKLAATADKHYQIYFVDTADPKLINAGLILRLRDKGNGQTETTVKFRPSPGSKALDSKWDGKLENENEWLIGKGENQSYSLKRVLDGTDLLKKPDDHLAEFFSDGQKALIKEISTEEFDPARLKVFGPIRAELWEWREAAVDDKVSAELWNLSDKQIFEVSRKAKAKNLQKKADEFEAAFRKIGLAVDPDPESKTRRALGYLRRP